VSPDALPLYQRVESRTVRSQYFYCADCGCESRFSWPSAFCTETGELVCCSSKFRLCRRCRQPRRLEQFGSELLWPCESTICNGCRVTPTRQPLQCAHCGNPFAPTRSDARFCSGRCRTAAHRARREVEP
jgi:hypothetical protein